MTRKQRGKKARGGLSSNNKTKRLFSTKTKNKTKDFLPPLVALYLSIQVWSHTRQTMKYFFFTRPLNIKKQHMLFKNRIKEDFRFVISIMEGNRDERIRQF